ncbi:MAG: CRISPR-associated helicase Cas3', partial [Candidatus Korarchaeota archaeon]|nr:CRISPR-associated helicase Cas3' [Candidatus Korarchaeota archaeon]
MSLIGCLERVLNTIPKDEKKERPFLNYALRRIEKSNISFIEAPTGYGKSVISQALALHTLENGLKVVVSFPLRTLLEDQYEKFERLLLSQSMDRDLLGVRYMHHPESRYLLRPVTLTTVDTLSLNLMGIAPEDLEKALTWYGTSDGSMGHYLFSRGSVIISDLVLDEAHLLADSTKSLNFLAALLRIAEWHGQRLVMMSATLPKPLEELLRKFDANVVKFSEYPDEAFLEERRRKRYNEGGGVEICELKESEKLKRIMEWLKEGLSSGFRRAIVVFNTVRDAISFYKEMRDELDLPKGKLLLHSRFSERDRRSKAEELDKLKRHSKEYII